jgi:hypothetical protein
VLLSSVMSSLLRCLSDPLPLIRQMAVEGLAGLVHCSPLEIETLAEVSLIDSYPKCRLSLKIYLGSRVADPHSFHPFIFWIKNYNLPIPRPP